MKKMRKALFGMFVAMLLSLTFVSLYIVKPARSQGVLVLQWTYNLQRFSGELMIFGSSPAIWDMRRDVQGLEVALGSDEYRNFYPELGLEADGIWRLLNSSGGLIWARDTGTGHSASSPAISDINEDGHLEIVGGTTSGENVEAMDRFGNFIWTFPWPPWRVGVPGLWHSSPAVADVDFSVSGLEVFIGNQGEANVWAFDGDNSDRVDEGITVSSLMYPGTEGIDWDVLWRFQTGSVVYSSPALGDINNDGQIEVVIGSGDNNVYALNGITGAQLWAFPTGWPVYSSAALANLDGDANLEVVIGSLDGYLYCLDGATGALQWRFGPRGQIYSSPAIYADTIYVGSVIGPADGEVYALNPNGNLRWVYDANTPIYSSPAIANRSVNFGVYIGTGNRYGHTVGSGALLLLDASNGSIIDSYVTASITTSPSVADVDGDGKLEIVFYDWSPYAGPAPAFYCLEDTGSNVSPYAIEWPMFRHDAMRTGRYPTIAPPPSVGGVGGVIISVDKLALLAPYIGLASTILVATAATAIYVKRVKRKKEKQ